MTNAKSPPAIDSPAKKEPPLPISGSILVKFESKKIAVTTIAMMHIVIHNS